MTPSRRRFIAAADAIVIALIVLAIVAELAVDFETRVLGVRITLKSTWRILAWALIVATVRHIVVAQPSLFARFRRPGLWTRDSAIPLPPQPHRALTVLLVLAFYTAVSAFVLWPQVAEPFAVPDVGDPLFSVWRLAWVAHQLPRDPLHLFDANIFYPHVRTLAYSDAMLVPALAAAPLFWLGIHPLVVYNVILFASTVLSGATMFALVRSLTNRTGAALIAGLLFAFSAFRFSHYSHLELLVTHWMPLALYYLHRAVLTQRTRYGVLTGLMVALQALSSLYYGIFLSVFIAVIVIAARIAGQMRLRPVLRPLAIGGLVALTVTLPATIPYWQNRGVVGERSEYEVQAFSARPLDHLSPGSRSVYRGYGATAENAERELFPGVAPIVLAVAGLWPPLSPLRLAYGIGLFFAFDASLGLSGEAYYWLHRLVPPFRGLRVPARFAMIVALALSILAGFGVARLINRNKSVTVRVAMVIVLAAVAFFDARPVLKLERIWRQPPSVYAALPADRKVVIADLPFPETEGVVWAECRYMYFSTFHWHRLLNGNSGFFPPDYKQLRETMLEFPSDRAVNLLRQYGAEFLVLHGERYGAAEYARVAAQVVPRTDLELVAVDQWEGAEVRLYKLR